MDEKRYSFANINVVLVGDLLQLPLVLGKQVFSAPKTKELKAYHDGLGDDALWEQFEPMLLKQNHRQGEAKEWVDTLNRLREGIITAEDEALLRTRLTKDEFLLEEAFHIFYFNKFVTEHNSKMLQKLLAELISVKALQSLPKGRKPFIDQNKGTIGDT